MNSTQRVALVTGASSGIGKSIVRRLLADGWIVYGAARRQEKMQDIASEGAKILPLDLSVDTSITECVNTITTNEGRVDALVNNAGYGSYGTIEDVPIDDARAQFEVNVFGLARLSQLVMPYMREKRSGTIVNISSMGGRIWMPVGGWYHATKHALEVLSDAMRVELAPFGVNVVVVQPGAIASEWNDIAVKSLLKHSEGSAYEKMVDWVANALSDYDYAASPDVVAGAVSKALRAKRPKRRYAVPFEAKLFIFVRWLVPDWLWERLVLARIRTAKPRA